MKYGTILGDPKQISRIVCGGDRGFENSAAFLDYAFERGINAFDTSRSYGTSENTLGSWMATKRREDVFVISKGELRNNEDHGSARRQILFDLELSLKALRTSYIDLFFFHYDAPRLPPAAILEIARELKRSGKVKFVGYSNIGIDRLVQVRDYGSGKDRATFAAVSAQLSLPVPIGDMWPGSISIGSKDDEPTRRSFREWGLAVFAYSCLGRGFFSDAYWNREQVDQTVVGDGGQDDRAHKTMQWLRARFHSASNIEKYRRAELLSRSRGVTPAQIGLAYVFHKDLDVFAVVGWTHNCRCDLNAAALDITLSQDEVEWLEGC